MHAPSPDLASAVQSGQAKRLALEELAGYEYFADAEGRVYSMNTEEPRLVDAKTGWGGLEWVVLMTREGWRRYCVGELIGEAFLAEQRPGSREDYTVAHLDGDARNNAASNLRWVTKLEASRQRTQAARPRPVRSAPPAEHPSEAALASVGVPESRTSTGEVERSQPAAETPREVLKLLERNRRTQERLDALTGEHQRLMAALTPFAQFAESPEVRVGHPDQTVLEANKGRPNYCRITAGDLRRALEVMRELERGRG